MRLSVTYLTVLRLAVLGLAVLRFAVLRLVVLGLVVPRFAGTMMLFAVLRFAASICYSWRCKMNWRWVFALLGFVATVVGCCVASGVLHAGQRRQ